MASSPAVEHQAQRNAAIVALAAQELTALWPRVDWDSPDAVTAVQRIYRTIVTSRGRTAATVAARFYDEIRRSRELPKQYRAIAAPPPPSEVLDRTVESAFRGIELTELDDHEHGIQTTSDLPAEQRVPARLDQKLQKHVLQAGRDTIAENVAQDPANAVYVRVPRGAKTCAFCVMLASRAIDVGFSGYGRHSVKWSEEENRNIHVTTGRGRTPTTSATGKTPVGQKYHTGCDCEPVPVFPGQEPIDVSPRFNDYQDMYFKASADAGSSSNTKKILVSMRQLYGVK
jgi:hypothetical protein